MNRLLFLILLFSIISCKENTGNTSTSETVIDTEKISVENNFNSYETIHGLLQGSWANILDPDSVVIFKGNTTTNMYQDIVSAKDVPFTLDTSCSKTVSVNSIEAYKYINTPGQYEECYLIKTLNKDSLVMDYLRGEITLSFTRLE